MASELQQIMNLHQRIMRWQRRQLGPRRWRANIKQDATISVLSVKKREKVRHSYRRRTLQWSKHGTPSRRVLPQSKCIVDLRRPQTNCFRRSG
eukprot:scaffold1351_cov176-Amphora_coffeaeformis.AAC.36